MILGKSLYIHVTRNACSLLPLSPVWCDCCTLRTQTVSGAGHPAQPQKPLKLRVPAARGQYWLHNRHGTAHSENAGPLVKNYEEFQDGSCRARSLLRVGPGACLGCLPLAFLPSVRLFTQSLGSGETPSDVEEILCVSMLVPLLKGPDCCTGSHPSQHHHPDRRSCRVASFPHFWGETPICVLGLIEKYSPCRVTHPQSCGSPASCGEQA